MLKITNFKHIIWDWNGTILDDSRIVYDVYVKMAVDEGLSPVEFSEFRKTFTFPAIKTYENLGFNVEEENFRRLISNFHTTYSEKLKSVSLHSGIKEIFEKLSYSNVFQSIISARPHNYLIREVPAYGVEKYFTSINGIQNEEGDSKVSLGVSYANELKSSKESVLFIGDTDHDFEVANAMGVKCLLVANGIQDKSILTKCDVDVVESLNDLKL